MRLNAIVDPERANGRSLAELTRMVVAGGATLIQLRDKHGATRQMIEEARAIKAVLAGTGVPLVINDRVDVALIAEADGVHVGQDDMRVEDARRLLGPKAIIGLSIKSVALAERRAARCARLRGRRRGLCHHLEGQSESADRHRGPYARSLRRSARASAICRSAASPGIDATQCGGCDRGGRRRRRGDLRALRCRPIRRRGTRAARHRRRGAEGAVDDRHRRHHRGLGLGGGAGIQADLKTFSALGVYGACVITALTAQNTQGVTGIHDVPPHFIAQQIDAVFSDLEVNAVKIGMLSVPVAIAAVAAGLERWRQTNVVLDPVMVATSGDRLLAPAAVETLKRELIPRALVITPNLHEAAALHGTPLAANRRRDARAGGGAARARRQRGADQGRPRAARGRDRPPGHADAVARLTAENIDTKNTHGTGCTLSAAIAAGLAKGLRLAEAVTDAKAYVTAAIGAADELSVGHGHGPVHHFHAWW